MELTKEVTKLLRYRVQVGTSVKGVKTWDCTVELEGPEGYLDKDYTSKMAEGYFAAVCNVLPPGAASSLESQILFLSDKLVAELEKRYPIKIEEK